MDLPKSDLFTERKHRSYRDKFTIVWMITRKCNFKCAYCYGTHEESDTFEIKEFIKQIKNVPQPFRIVVTGGEPFILPWMIEWCQEIGKIGGTIEMQTNFSLQTREFIDNTSPDYIEIIETSFHPSQRNKEEKKKFVDDFFYARDKGFKIKTWLIDYPKLKPEEFLADCAWLHSNGIVPARKRYCGDEYGGGIGDAIFVPNKKCLAGYKGVSLWENFDFSPCDHDRTVLGNLFTGFKFLDEPIKCQKQFCGCLGRELIVDKFYDEFYKKEFGA